MSKKFGGGEGNRGQKEQKEVGDRLAVQHRFLGYGRKTHSRGGRQKKTRGGKLQTSLSSTKKVKVMHERDKPTVQKRNLSNFKRKEGCGRSR